MKKIKLTRGLESLVDDEDYEILNRFKWQANKSFSNNTFYARRSSNGKNKKRITLSMHRVILNITDSKIQIDHINGNGLDNRKENLRIASGLQNHHNVGMRKDNSTGFKGVDYKKSNKKFRARINYNGKSYFLGLFETAEEASIVYEVKAKEYFGKFYKDLGKQK